MEYGVGAAGPSPRQGSEVLVALVRGFWIILLCLVLGGQAGFLVSYFTSPVYQAEANLIVMQVSENSTAEAARLSNYTRAYSELATIPEVVGDAVREGGADPREIPRLVTVEASPDTPLIQITTNSDDPQKAADLANSVGSAVVSFTEGISEETQYEAEVVAEATPPEAPSWPNTPLNVAVGATTGLLVGGAAALARGDRPRRAGRTKQRDPEETAGAASEAPEQDTRTVEAPEPAESSPVEPAAASDGVTEEPPTEQPEAPKRVRENNGGGGPDFWFRRSRLAGLAADRGRDTDRRQRREDYDDEARPGL